jgi:hypothetical protein
VGERWHRLVSRDGVRPVWEFLVTLRPVWWVIRAWIVVEAIDVWWGGAPFTIVPSITDGIALGVPVLLAAVVASVLLGRRRFERTCLRLLVLTGNVGAVLVFPHVADHLEWRNQTDTGPAYSKGWNHGYNQASSDFQAETLVVAGASDGLAFNGQPVINVFPYDANGKPLTGVQLFNENGDPLVLNKNMATEERKSITYPWLRSGAGVWNVFPMPVGPWLDDPNKGFRDDIAWFSPTPPTLPVSPVAEVRPVSLPKGPR